MASIRHSAALLVGWFYFGRLWFYMVFVAYLQLALHYMRRVSWRRGGKKQAGVGKGKEVDEEEIHGVGHGHRRQT